MNGALNIGASGALSPSTAITVSSTGTIDFKTFTNPGSGANTSSLTSSGTVLNQGQVIIPTILITNGTLGNTGGALLSGDASGNSTITIQGGTITNGSSVVFDSSQLGNSTTSVVFNGGSVNNNAFINCSTYTQGAGTTLQEGFGLTGSSAIQVGTVTGSGSMSLNGNLVVRYFSGTQPTSGGKVLLSTSGIISGVFSTISSQGFTTTPRFVYSANQVQMFFGGSTAQWIKTIDGNWGGAVNWNPQNIPGVQGNTDDVANFGAGGSASIAVTLANSTGTQVQSVILNQLNFSQLSTSYTIQQYNNEGTITFDSTSAVPQIGVVTGSHTINAPIHLNQNTYLVLTDGAALTFGSVATVESTGSSSTQRLMVEQSGANGTGQLINNGNVTPYAMSILGGTVVNNTLIQPVNNLTIDSSPVDTATVFNTVAGAKLGPSGVRGSMIVGGSGGVVSITNSGLKLTMGAFGEGGTVTVNSGTIVNSSGAIFQAGSGGSLTIAGGAVTNDLTSTVGSNLANLLLSGGLLDTSGDVLAFDYVQNGTSTLKLNLTQMPSVFGRVQASGTVQVGSNLVVNALSGSNPAAGQIIDLLTAIKGVNGTFSSVDFLNFPPTLIPAIVYTPNAVELVFTDTVPPDTNGGGVAPQLTTILSDSVNILIERGLSDLHRRIKKKKHSTNEPIALLAENDLQAESSEIALGEWFHRKKSQTAQRILKNMQDELLGRVYLGPIDSFGEFRSRGSVQPGLGFNRIGALAGADYAFSEIGFGLAANYSAVDAKVCHHSGYLDFDQIHGSFYGIWVPSRMQAFAISTILGGGYDWYSVKRPAGPSIAPVEARGKPRGSEFDAFLGLEYIFSKDQFVAIPEQLNFTPIANVQYLFARVEKYCEHGSGIYDLKVKVPEAKILWSTLGARLDFLLQGENITLRPELDLGWRYQFFNQCYQVDYATIQLTETKNVSLPIVGVGRHTLWFGVDFMLTVCKSFELEVSYDLQWNKLFKSNTFYAGIGGQF